MLANNHSNVYHNAELVNLLKIHLSTRHLLLAIPCSEREFIKYHQRNWINFYVEKTSKKHEEVALSHWFWVSVRFSLRPKRKIHWKLLSIPQNKRSESIRCFILQFDNCIATQFVGLFSIQLSAENLQSQSLLEYRVANFINSNFISQLTNSIDFILPVIFLAWKNTLCNILIW